MLRRRLAALTEEARKNDDAWRRAQAREMELLEADTLDALLERLTSGIARRAIGSRRATLVIADPDHEIRRLLSLAGPAHRPRKAACVFVDSVHGVAPAVAAGAPALARQVQSRRPRAAVSGGGGARKRGLAAADARRNG